LPNHVIYDRIWESKKLAGCTLKAALAYPWIYLVADDWGRFEYQPRVIWGRVFAQRTDVKPGDVEGWLAEYQDAGLLRKYEVLGRLVCQWTRFSGPPPSRRRAAVLPAQDGTIETEGLRPKSRFHDANNKVALCFPEVRSKKQEAGSKKQEVGSVREAPPSADVPRLLSPDDDETGLTDPEKYGKRVWVAWVAKRGRGGPEMSSAEWDLAMRWQAELPLGLVLQAIQDCGGKWPNPRMPLTYAGPAVKAEAERVSRGQTA
jgi:hypothetical protein